MNEVVLEPTDADAERIKMEIESLFKQMELLAKQRQRAQERLERSKAESRQIAQRVDAALARLDNAR